MTKDEKIAKLGKEITDRATVLLGKDKITPDAPEYLGINSALKFTAVKYDEKMADDILDIALTMKKRVPLTIEQLAKKNPQFDRAYLEKAMQAISESGLVEFHWENLDGKNPNHEKRWVLDMFVPGSAEIMMINPEQSDMFPETADFFERMAYLPLAGITEMVPPGGAGIGMHVIPVEKAIPATNESVDVEHISHWLKKYEGKYAAGPCSCRMSRAAMGEGCGAKLFYLTARNTTQAAAEDAVARLRAAQPGLALRSVTLTAKEKACLHPDAEGHPSCLPEVCPFANGYYDRRKDALVALLDGSGSFSRAALADTARQFSVCPFELGLDLSEWCDVVIGDYNYLFDPVVHLKRFFDAAGDWLFLIDEAHNLPDRARAMYSAQFAKSSLTEAKRALGKGKSSLKTALTKADKVFLAARKACAQAAPRTGAEPSGETEPTQVSLLPAEAAPDFALPQPLYARDGTVFLQQLPAALPAALRAVHTPLQDWLEQNPEDPAHAQLLELYFAMQDIARAADRYDSHFVTQLTARGSELELHLLCLDPAPFVDASLAAGRSAALFSATLTPPAFYRSVLGCADARAVALPSPFPPENLGLFCLPGISTRYRQREASVPAVADALAALAKGKTGNYLAFFPSYAYLRQVYEDFTARYPDIGTLAQESGLDDAARAAFLEQFSPSPAKTLLGFGVMGGIFGEGVDLAGDRLIGCAIVGVGLPQVNPRQEMLRRYYDAQNGAGFDYAYRYPGMNKVLQAAGRVIRTPEDKGVVLLLDYRFAKPEYQRLFPLHWKHLQYLPGPAALEAALADFWSSKPE